METGVLFQKSKVTLDYTVSLRLVWVDEILSLEISCWVRRASQSLCKEKGCGSGRRTSPSETSGASVVFKY